MKFFTGRRTVIRPRGGEDGNVLITVVLVSMVIGMLGSLVMATSRQADSSSASDKNHELALSVAESGIHETVSKLSAQTEQGLFPATPAEFSAAGLGGPGSTANGPYDVDVSRCVSDLASNPAPCQQMNVTDGYVIESLGQAGLPQSGRERRIRASIEPAELFPGEEGPYSLFSYKSITLKGNDVIGGGDIWANDSITMEQNNKIYGNVTSATSWIQGAKSGIEVFGDVWSGGYHCTPEVPDDPTTAGPCEPDDLWGIDLRGGGSNVAVHGSAKSSVSTSCASAPQSPNYDIKGGNIAKDGTANGAITGAVTGANRPFTCTPAAPKKELPAFQYTPSSYSPAPHDFTSIADFEAFTDPLIGAIEGTFHVIVSNPSQANRVDITNWNLAGDVTIVTNAPIYSDDLNDTALSGGEKAKLVLVTTYDPPESGLQCLLEGNNHEQSECAIHFKNHLQPGCGTAVLFHAKYGPVAIKNNNDMCGSIMSDGIQIKNNQRLNYDSRFDRVTGFGNPGYELARWEECSVSGCD